MSDYVVPIVSLGLLMLLGAWREYASDNQRNAKLLAACGAGGMLAGAVVRLARPNSPLNIAPSNRSS